MSIDEKEVPLEKPWRLSLDSWAVVVALLAALLVRAGVFKHIPW
ncbi:MAG TPA: hypothetical protein VKH63_14820 [Candidatus Acidoferrum sp.]|jgi:hypothetical protein|nr:hypothetical protein [Candidatus Acidoferrum sp.]